MVRDAIISAEVRDRAAGGVYWSLPVVGETWDGALNDINGFHVRAEHALAALDAARERPGRRGQRRRRHRHDLPRVQGRDRHGVAGRSAPRTAATRSACWCRRTTASGRASRVNGVPVGREITADEVPGAPRRAESREPARSSRWSRRTRRSSRPSATGWRSARAWASRGWAALGGHTSGDIFLCFATGNSGLVSSYKMDDPTLAVPVKMLLEQPHHPLFEAVVEATEEAILNAMVAATTTTGINGNTVYALPHDRLLEVMEKYKPRD